MAGGIDWFRWHHGTVKDEKFQLVARRSGASLPDVLAVWAYLLEKASAAESRGHFGDIDCEAVDCLFGFPSTETRTQDVIAAMGQRNLIADGRIVRWDARQPKRERTSEEPPGASTERVRQHRAKQGQSSAGNATDARETPDEACNGQKRARGEESREEEKNTGGEGAHAPDAPADAAGAPPPPPPHDAEGEKPGQPGTADQDQAEAMPAAWRSFIATTRPELPADAVYANFRDHYPLRRQTDANWRKWVRREIGRYGPGPPGAPPVTTPPRRGRDPTLARIEAESAKAVKPPAAIRDAMRRLSARPSTPTP